MEKNKFSIYTKMIPKLKLIYSNDPFTMKPIMDSAWKETKEKKLLERKDEVWDKYDEMFYRNIVMNPPEWLQKYIDDDK